MLLPVKRVLKAAGVLIGVIVLVIALAWVIGLVLPSEHTATRMARYQQSPEQIWDALTNVQAMPSWRSDLRAIKRMPDKNGLPAWLETSSFGDIPLEVQESHPPRRLVARIADSNLPFGGTWTYEITPVDGGSTLRITENGEIRSPLFRFMSRFIFGYSSTMEAYLRNLGTKFGEQPRVEH